MEALASPTLTVRALTPEDLRAVVAIDAAIEGRSRSAYIERRLAAARRDPPLHAQFAAIDEQGLAGYILARVLEDEFGRGGRSLRLELIGVRPQARGLGIGKRLFEVLSQWARRHEILELRTLATWNNASMLRWLDSMGFRLADDHVVDCAVGGGGYQPERDDALGLALGEGPGHEINFGDRSGNDYERMARDTADVHTMTMQDLSDIVRIDRGITGRNRAAYMQAKLAEAVDDAGLRVSLAARRDGLNVGYLMARLDRGDFGRTEPVAIIDTIGVDPEHARHGVGRALMSQLFANLGSLRVERVETVVPARDLNMLGFLFSVGFAPSQRLPFARGIE
ncbi:MAG: GNAT family N-acetyltransferase [Rhizobacter sp.]|nr:GNAT family N-acetyltransferase [Rhizobacter sp.]